jgi:lysozyme
MNLDQLKQELAEDEGCKYEIYLDHLGLPTVGIGHLITEDDPEARMNVGTPVSEERVNMLFRRDIAVTVDDCHRLYDDFKDLPEEAQLIIANMMFNLGYPRLSKFVGMKSCVDKRDFNGAAEEMIDSKWFDQVPNRAKRLVARMRSIEDA